MVANKKTRTARQGRGGIAERSRLDASKSTEKPAPPPCSPVKGKSGARPESRQVKHKNRIVIPAGLGVEAAWCSAFVANEGLQATDEVITSWMRAAFPGRESKTFSQVQHVRYKYNRGKFKATKGVPKTQAVRYTA